MSKICDKNGIEILPNDILKVFHYVGARNKKHFMFKLVKEINGRLAALHLGDDEAGYFYLTGRTREFLDNIEIVQGMDYHEGRYRDYTERPRQPLEKFVAKKIPFRPVEPELLQRQ